MRKIPFVAITLLLIAVGVLLAMQFFSIPEIGHPASAADSPAPNPVSRQPTDLQPGAPPTLPQVIVQTPPVAPGAGMPTPPPIPPEILERMRDPQVRATIAERMKADAKTMYADLLAGLSPADREKMTAAIVEEQMLRGERAVTQGAPPTFDKIRQEISESEARLRAAMGDELFAVYQAGRTSMPQRRLVRDFSSRLSSSGERLTDEQNAALLKVLVVENASRPNNTTPDAIPRMDTARISREATKILTAKQVGALEYFLDAQARQAGRPR